MLGNFINLRKYCNAAVNFPFKYANTPDIVNRVETAEYAISMSRHWFNRE